MRLKRKSEVLRRTLKMSLTAAADSRAGPHTDSAAGTQDERLQPVDLYIQRNGELWSAGAAGLDTGSLDSVVSASIAQRLRNDGKLEDIHKEYITVDGRDVTAQQQLTLAFCIEGVWYKTVFLVVPDSRCFDFQLGTKFLFRHPELLIKALSARIGLPEIMELTQRMMASAALNASEDS